MSKRGIALFLSLVLGLTAGVGCAKKDEKPAETTKTETKTEAGKKDDTAAETKEGPTGKITVQMIGGYEMETTTDPVTGVKKQGVEIVKEEFEKRFPGTEVEYILMGWDSYTQKTQTMLSVNEADVYQVPGIAGFADQGFLEPLAPFIEKDKFDLGQLIDGQIDGWKAMGPDETELGIYGLPIIGDTRVIMYDKTIFDQWGVEYLSEKPTLDEIAEKSAKMTGKNPVTGEQNYGIAWRGRDSADTIVNIAEALGGQWGEGFRLNEIKVEFDSDEFKKASEYLYGLLPYAPTGIMTGQGLENFGTAKNNIAINLRVGPNNYYNTYVTKDTVDQYGVSYLFVNEEKGMGGMFAGSPYSIGKTSDNKDLAWEYIKFMTSDFYQEWQWKNHQSLPVVKSATGWEDFKNTPGMELVLDSMGYLWTPRYPYRAGQPRSILTDSVEKFMLNETSIDEALKGAKTETDAWVASLNK